MSDYTRSFNGAALDADEAAVDPLLFEAEFDKIEAAIVTKADDIVGGTNDQLIKVDANGNLVDGGGIAVADLTGISSNVQTAINTGYVIPTPHENFFQSGGFHLYKDDGMSFSGSSIHNDTWVTLGGVASGATFDPFWFDERVPSDATHVYMGFVLEIDNASGTTNDSSAQLYVADGDDTPSLTDKYLIIDHVDRLGSGRRQSMHWRGFVPIGTTSRTIQWHCVSDTTSLHSTIFYYQVFGSLRAGG